MDITNTKNEKTFDKKNSDVLKRTLMSLIIVARSKTSDDYAWASTKKLLNELRTKYDFLTSVSIGDISKINYVIDDISILSSFDKIEATDVGRAIQDIIDLLKKYLGKKAGYFFIQEFKEVLGEEYYQVIKNMGVDLRLVELQNEMSGIKIDEYRIKDSGSSNIAFVERVK